MACLLALLTIASVDNEEAALYVGHHDLRPHSDVLVRIQGNGEPLLAPGPDPARIVPTTDLPRDEGGVANHALDPVEHATSLFLFGHLHLFGDLHLLSDLQSSATDIGGLPLLHEGGQGLVGVLAGEIHGLAAGFVLEGFLHGGGQ
jgi:hypothetical protein